MTPRISVLVPTRQRTGLLDKMLRSLCLTADHPESVEVVFRVDYDDTETLAYLQNREVIAWFSMLGDTPYVVGSRRNGYATLPTMINDAARVARADLLIVINDDAEFKSQGWDRRLCEEAAKYPDGLFNFGVDTVMNNPNFVFPCQSRRQVELLGCFFDERLVYTDIWLRDVLGGVGRLIRVNDVVIEHQWAGMSEDQVHAVHSIVNTLEYSALYNRCVEEGRQKLIQAAFSHA